MRQRIVTPPAKWRSFSPVAGIAFGGTARSPRATTLGFFVYMYGFLGLLYSCSLNLAVGLLRFLSPEVSGAIFEAVNQGTIEVFLPVIQQRGLLPAAGLIALAVWPVVVVPIACWGAFRIENGVSRFRSAVALVVSLTMGVIVYQALTFISTRASAA